MYYLNSNRLLASLFIYVLINRISSWQMSYFNKILAIHNHHLKGAIEINLYCSSAWDKVDGTTEQTECSFITILATPFLKKQFSSALDVW